MENRKRDIQILFPFQLHMTLLRQAYIVYMVLKKLYKTIELKDIYFKERRNIDLIFIIWYTRCYFVLFKNGKEDSCIEFSGDLKSGTLII